MSATDTPLRDAPVERPQGWPELITSPVFFVREHGDWHAVLVRFDIVGVGCTPAAAWREMDELADTYLRSCAEASMPYEDVERHVPLKEVLRLAGHALVRRITHPRRQTRSHERFVRPLGLNGQHLAC
jgi:hypothetical protein